MQVEGGEVAERALGRRRVNRRRRTGGRGVSVSVCFFLSSFSLAAVLDPPRVNHHGLEHALVAAAGVDLDGRPHELLGERRDVGGGQQVPRVRRRDGRPGDDERRVWRKRPDLLGRLGDGLVGRGRAPGHARRRGLPLPDGATPGEGHRRRREPESEELVRRRRRGRECAAAAAADLPPDQSLLRAASPTAGAGQDVVRAGDGSARRIRLAAASSSGAASEAGGRALLGRSRRSAPPPRPSWLPRPAAFFVVCCCSSRASSSSAFVAPEARQGVLVVLIVVFPVLRVEVPAPARGRGAEAVVVEEAPRVGRAGDRPRDARRRRRLEHRPELLVCQAVAFLLFLVHLLVVLLPLGAGVLGGVGGGGLGRGNVDGLLDLERGGEEKREEREERK